MRIVFWGTYDTGKPRTRILLRGLRENNAHVIECHENIWGGVEDKSQIAGQINKLYFLAHWLLSYPRLLFRYLKLPKHDIVVVGYMGHLDVLVLWFFAMMRGVPIVWDAFLSLYETVVQDRKLISQHHPFSLLLFLWEWLACRAADRIILDTRAHADYFLRQFHIPASRIGVVFVGAEPDAFPALLQPKHERDTVDIFTVLFYGQFIPLHGIETIIMAAQQLRNSPIKWIIIGKGQDEKKISVMLKDQSLPRLKWVPWVPYAELILWIQRADVCLGIFGSSEKAALVIPNKVFQVLSAGKALITRDSPAIRELLNPGMPGIFLIPPSNAKELVYAIEDFSRHHRVLAGKILHRDVFTKIEPKAVGRMLIDEICGMLRP